MLRSSALSTTAVDAGALHDSHEHGQRVVSMWHRRRKHNRLHVRLTRRLLSATSALAREEESVWSYPQEHRHAALHVFQLIQ